MTDVVLKVEGLNKKFCRSLKRSMLYGTVDAMMDMANINRNPDLLRKKEFWALKDINLELKRGETLGLIGQNGCGKTTLLRLINGIFPPDSGKITIKGRIGALIAVGAGFHPYMSGRENIYLNGTILGMNRLEIKRKFDEIVDFAEIGEFLDAPVATYSSGMTVRLGFAIAIHCEPDILLLDEILAVGDLGFQQKCFAKIGTLFDNGTSVIFVSHNISQVQLLCKKTILLKKGQIVNYDLTQNVLSEYYNDKSKIGFEEKIIKKEKIISSYNITYKFLKTFNINNEETITYNSGDDIIVEWGFEMDEQINDVSMHFSMANDNDTYHGYSTYYDEIPVKKINSKSVIRIHLKKVILSPGDYTLSIGLWDGNFIGCYFWDYVSTGRIKISNRKRMLSRFQFDHEWIIKSD